MHFVLFNRKLEKIPSHGHIVHFRGRGAALPRRIHRTASGNCLKPGIHSGGRSGGDHLDELITITLCGN
jgi:hypothetical protein